MKTNSQFTIVSLAAALLATAACSVHGSSSATPLVTTPGASADPQQGKVAPTPAPSSPGASSPNLTGKWATTCFAGANGGEIDSYTFTGNTFVQSADSYADSACSGTSMMSMSMHGKYLVGAAISTETSGYNLDLTFLSDDSSQTMAVPTIIVVTGSALGSALYLPSPSDQTYPRPTHVDRSKAYIKVGG